MRHHKAGWAALAIMLVGCSDIAMEPSPTGYAVTGHARVMDKATGELMDYTPPTGQGGGTVTASVVGSGSGAALTVADGQPGIAPVGSHSHTIYTDSAGRENKVVFLWNQAGPTTASFHYVNAKLVAYTSFTWKKIPGGYYNSLQTLHVVDPKGVDLGQYNMVGEYDVVTAPCNPKVTSNCGPAKMVRGPQRHVSPLERVGGLAAMAMANSCFVQDALAEAGNACVLEWLLYAGTMASLIGEAAVPVIGWAAAIGSWIAASAALAIAVRCQEGKSAPLLGQGGAGAGAGAGAGGGGGGCGNGIVTDGCVTLTYTQ